MSEGRRDEAPSDPSPTTATAPVTGSQEPGGNHEYQQLVQDAISSLLNYEASYRGAQADPTSRLNQIIEQYPADIQEPVVQGVISQLPNLAFAGKLAKNLLKLASPEQQKQARAIVKKKAAYGRVRRQVRNAELTKSLDEAWGGPHWMPIDVRRARLQSATPITNDMLTSLLGITQLAQQADIPLLSLWEPDGILRKAVMAGPNAPRPHIQICRDVHQQMKKLVASKRGELDDEESTIMVADDEDMGFESPDETDAGNVQFPNGNSVVGSKSDERADGSNPLQGIRTPLPSSSGSTLPISGELKGDIVHVGASVPADYAPQLSPQPVNKTTGNAPQLELNKNEIAGRISAPDAGVTSHIKAQKRKAPQASGSHISSDHNKPQDPSSSKRLRGTFGPSPEEVYRQLTLNVPLTDDVLHLVSRVLLIKYGKGNIRLLDPLWFVVDDTESLPQPLRDITSDPNPSPLILFPIHHRQEDHWTLAGAYVLPFSVVFTFYDSLYNAERAINVRNRFKRWMEACGMSQELEFCESENAQQKDGTSCGIFVLTFLRHLIQNPSKELPLSIQPHKEREELVSALGTVDQSQLSPSEASIVQLINKGKYSTTESQAEDPEGLRSCIVKAEKRLQEATRARHHAQAQFEYLAIQNTTLEDLQTVVSQNVQTTKRTLRASDPHRGTQRRDSGDPDHEEDESTPSSLIPLAPARLLERSSCMWQLSQQGIFDGIDIVTQTITDFATRSTEKRIAAKTDLDKALQEWTAAKEELERLKVTELA